MTIKRGVTMNNYDKAFKAEAIRLVLTSNQSIAKTARDLGLKDGTLYNWLSQERNHAEKQTDRMEK